MSVLVQALKPLRRAASSGAGPIGLDIGSRLVKAVQLARGANGAWTTRALSVFPRATNNGGKLDVNEANRIGDVLFRQGFIGREIVLAIPDDKLLAANLELPPRSGEIPLDQIARAEFGRSLKVESEALEFAYWDLPAPARAARATHVMGVGCRHSDCEPAIDAFEAAGYELRAMEVEACALTRACFPVSAPPDQITAIVDIGWQAVRLFVVYQSVVSYRRTLAGMGLARAVKEIARLLGITEDHESMPQILGLATLAEAPATADVPTDIAGGIDDVRRLLQSHFDAVASEVTTSLSYTGHQYPDAPVRRVLLTGGGARIDGLPAHLSARLNVETIPVRAAELVQCDDAQLAQSTAMTLAIGLAQVGADE